MKDLLIDVIVCATLGYLAYNAIGFMIGGIVGLILHAVLCES